MKAATFCQVRINLNALISIHAAREGGDRKCLFSNVDGGISIHAAREGGDPEMTGKAMRHLISIHAAREGGDVLRLAATAAHTRFQSTPPVKAATLCPIQLTQSAGNFNPRRP